MTARCRCDTAIRWIDAQDQKAVDSAVKKLWAKITRLLAKGAGMEIDAQGIIENKGQGGYRFTDHITVAGSLVSPDGCLFRNMRGER